MAGGNGISPRSRSPARVRRLFEAELRRGLRRCALENDSQALIVAVSGGADSTALLLAVRAVLPERRLVACHIDHGLRPADERAAEQMLLAETCGRLAVALVVRAVEVPKREHGRPLSPEDAARRARYAALVEIAREAGAGAVVTGHTRDDQSETVLLRAARGTGLRGLRGLLSRSTPWGPGGPVLLRPLLGLTHADCFAYCAARGERWSEDSSNADTAFARNRVRQEALPALRRAQPGADAALARLGEQAASLADWLDGEVEAQLTDVLEPRADGLLLRRVHHAMHPFVASEIVAAALRRFDDSAQTPPFEIVVKLLDLWEGRAGRRYQLRGGVVYATREGLLLCRTAANSGARRDGGVVSEQGT